jgi:general stress protein 26
MAKTKQEHFDRIRELIGKLEFGHMTTVDGDGFPRTRAMEDHNPYEGFTLWFATNAGTRKVAEIWANPRGSVYYDLAPQGEKGYINILGTWEVRDDEEGRNFLWREEWEAYWPEGPAAESYTPLKLTPGSIEYYNETDPTSGCLVIMPDEVDL